MKEVAIVMLSVITVASCADVQSQQTGEPEGVTATWAATSSDETACQIAPSPSTCEGCLTLDPLADLGLSEAGDAFLEDNGTLGNAVRDSDGRFWVGQRDRIKVYDGTGSFIATVGREGQGPMEFLFAQPSHQDRDGNIHVLDPRNVRESVIDADFNLVSDSRLPQPFQSATALHDGRYVLQMWIADDPQRIGFPLHVTDGSEVTHSFGMPTGSEELTPFNSRRVLATHPEGYIFAARDYDYLIEAWTSEGERLAVIEGATLNETPVQSGPWSDENPPANRIRSLRLDEQQRLWVITRLRRPDWRENMEEVIGAGGSVALRPVDGTIASYYHSRIDIIDLNTCRMLATHPFDGVLLTFADQNVVSELRYTELGTPILRMIEVTMPLIENSGQ